MPQIGGSDIILTDALCDVRMRRPCAVPAAFHLDFWVRQAGNRLVFELASKAIKSRLHCVNMLLNTILYLPAVVANVRPILVRILHLGVICLIRGPDLGTLARRPVAKVADDGDGAGLGIAHLAVKLDIHPDQVLGIGRVQLGLDDDRGVARGLRHFDGILVERNAMEVLKCILGIISSRFQ